MLPNLKNLTFDPVAFLEMPKCKGEWQDKYGAGCLLTAFWKGFGFSFIKVPNLVNDLEYMYQLKDILFPLDLMVIETNELIQELGLNFSCHDIVTDYDELGGGIKALQLIWQLIDKLPNKATIVNEKAKEDLKLNICSF